MDNDADEEEERGRGVKVGESKILEGVADEEKYEEKEEY